MPDVDTPAVSGAATLLVVEDQSVSGFIRAALGKQGYRIICADPESAMEVLEAQRQRVDALITNAPLRFAAFPAVPVLYIAACPDLQVLEPFDRTGVLGKPFHPAQLSEALEKLLVSSIIPA